MKLYNLDNDIKIEAMEEINIKILFDFILFIYIFIYTININDYD